MKHIKTINKSSLKNSLCKPGCKECANSCQSACKTSCTVANLACENSKHILDISMKRVAVTICCCHALN